MIQAVIFDMDGVLLDSEPLHHQTMNAILAEEGCRELSVTEYAAYMGTTDVYTWQDVIDRFQLPRPFSYYRDRYDTLILEQYCRSAKPAAGAGWLLGELKARGLRLAVASSSRSTWVEICLRALGMRSDFELVVNGDMVAHSKPNPEIYLLAASMLAVPPESCLVVEDAPNGIAAARAAGMFTVAVETAYTLNEDTSAADVHLRSLADFDFSLLGEDRGRPQGVAPTSPAKQP